MASGESSGLGMVGMREPRRDPSQRTKVIPNLTTSTRYKYVPLESQHHIRVICVSPGDGDEPLFCEIHHVDLDDDPSYEALSYVWGDPELVHRLEISGDQYICITTSLHQALRDLRLANIDDGTTTLWVDACCINQGDILEHNQQLSMMGTIYRNARSVVTYIGPEYDDSAEALNFAAKLDEYACLCPGHAKDIRMSRDLHKLPEIGLPAPKYFGWKALRRLFRRPWSSRVWIAQEFALNKNDEIVCGKISVPWSLLYRVIFHSRTEKLPSLVLHDPDDGDERDVRSGLHGGLEIINVELMAFLRSRTVVQDRGFTLGELLKRCHSLKSTDPRDMIFGLLGLATDSEQLQITADYGIPVSNVYIHTATRLLETSQGLELLSCVSDTKSVKLPSWVPDWSTFPGRSRIYDSLHHRAHGTTNSDIYIDVKTNHLILRGLLFDEVSTLTAELKSCPLFQKKGSSPSIWLREQLAILTSLSNPYPNGDSPTTALWRTLIANRTHNGVEATSEYENWWTCFRKICGLGDSFHLRYNLDIKEAESTARYNHTMRGSDYYVSLDDAGIQLGYQYVKAFGSVAQFRSLCITKKGYLGLVPEETRIGDRVAVFMGGHVPFVLRRADQDTEVRNETEYYKLIGESYVHGIMKGEAFEMDDVHVEKIRLV